MQILLANAKIMFDKVPIKREQKETCFDYAGCKETHLKDKSDVNTLTEPIFQSVANNLAIEMATRDIDTLAKDLDCSRSLAAENWRRYQNFFTAEKLPAIMAYNGQAYKHLKANTLSKDALAFGQEHLWITCFLYGLLRPMDGIVPYRMEHCVKLTLTHNKPINTFWKDKLTDFLIDIVKADDGILVHLSTEEYEHLFDWKRVTAELKVIHPLFYVRQKDGRLKMQAVWAKSCRGAMVRYILQNQITNPHELKAFSYEGFEYNPNIGEELFPHFVREI